MLYVLKDKKTGLYLNGVGLDEVPETFTSLHKVRKVKRRYQDHTFKLATADHFVTPCFVTIACDLVERGEIPDPDATAPTIPGARRL